MSLSDFPHFAQINFFIDIFPMMPDGSLSPKKLTISDFESEGITKTAIFGVHGFSKDDCIKNLKETLTRLDYEKK